jgi:hypothetical protein
LKWSIITSKENKDTIIQYNFFKEDLRDLRLYISYLRSIEEQNKINEELILKQELKLNEYQKVVDEKNSTIASQGVIIKTSKESNTLLDARLQKAEQRANKWPLWLGGGLMGGFIGGMLVWQLTK